VPAQQGALPGQRATEAIVAGGGAVQAGGGAQRRDRGEPLGVEHDRPGGDVLLE